MGLCRHWVAHLDVDQLAGGWDWRLHQEKGLFGVAGAKVTSAVPATQSGRHLWSTQWSRPRGSKGSEAPWRGWRSWAGAEDLRAGGRLLERGSLG